MSVRSERRLKSMKSKQYPLYRISSTSSTPHDNFYCFDLSSILYTIAQKSFDYFKGVRRKVAKTLNPLSALGGT
jgi:hypothetical protein